MTNAEIIAVGTELLTPTKIDTNSLFLTEELNGLGVEVVAKTIVGDDRARLAEMVRSAAHRSPIVILTGGLGPTEDDVTRDAVGAALDLQQRFDPAIAEGIEQRFRRMGRQMAEINKRQAYLLEGAEALPNDRGTAPGQYLTHRGGVVMLLPGPPSELKPMFRQQCLPRLAELLPPQAIATRFFRVAGMTESDLDALIAPVYTQYENPVTTILAAAGDLQVHLRARKATLEEAEALATEVGQQIEALLGERLYSRGGEPLEEALGALLRERHATLSVAESATGGLVAQRLTSVPNSSDYFLGGFVVYTDEMKRNLLGLDDELLAKHTSVSEAAAEAMALGAQEKTASDYALSVTGYAGPAGGDEANPVGTMYIGVTERQNRQVHRFRFLGDRQRVRTLAAQTALDLLRRHILR